jgi:sugar phosphate isomerase/epimerase
LKRRSLFALTAAFGSSLNARKLTPVGVQLYTVRKIILQDPLKILREIEKIGYREVEATADNVNQIWPSLQQTSLKPVSIHLDTNLFIRDHAKLPAALEDAKKRGFEYIVCPYIDPKDRGGIDMMRRLGQSLNKAGDMASKHGLQLCYHNHAFEFAPAERRTLLDVLLETADPKLVKLELDIMWSRVAGVDPVSVLLRFGQRIPLVHLKNVAPGVPRMFNEDLPAKDFRDLGHGVIKVADVLKAGAQVGVKHYFVEQDETPGNPIDSLRASYQHLQSIDF